MPLCCGVIPFVSTSFSGSLSGILSISETSYSPAKSSGNASLSAVTNAHLRIITQGIVFHVAWSFEYSSRLTTDLIGNLWSLTYTSHQPRSEERRVGKEC